MVDFDLLKAPFPLDSISWRAQSVTQDGTKALALAYVDARDVMNRLDEVCGPAGWQCKYSHANGKTVCDIGIKVRPTTFKCTDPISGQYELAYEGEWVWKADGAGDSDIEAEKGALSDAFKRAAVRWGIGRYLYDIDSPWVPCESYKSGEKWKWKCFTADPWKCIKGKKPISSFPVPKDRGRFHRELIAQLNAATSLSELESIIEPHKELLKQMRSSDADIDKDTVTDIESRYVTLRGGFKADRELKQQFERHL